MTQLCAWCVHMHCRCAHFCVSVSFLPPVFAFCIVQTLGKLHFGSRYQVLLKMVLKLPSILQIVLNTPCESLYS